MFERIREFKERIKERNTVECLCGGEILITSDKIIRCTKCQTRRETVGQPIKVRLEEIFYNSFDSEVPINENAILRKDLGLDSLDLMDMFLDIEDDFDFEIPEEEYRKIDSDCTFGDVVKMIEKESDKHAETIFR